MKIPLYLRNIVNKVRLEQVQFISFPILLLSLEELFTMLFSLLKQYLYVPYDVMRSFKWVFQPKFVSEFGEDRLLKELFQDVDDGVYLDIGCHHPIRESNTYYLHAKKGWSGFNIDANKLSIKLFNIFRPKDVNLNIGIGLKDGVSTFYEFSPLHCQNTFDKPTAEEVQHKTGQKFRETERQVSTIESVLKANDIRKIDYLNIDAEGLDTLILGSFPFSLIRPRIITLEAHVLINTPEYFALEEMAKKYGYIVISCCGPTYFLADKEQLRKNKWNFFTV